MTARGLGLLGRWLLTGHPLGCTCADCAEIDRGATGLVAALGDAADRAGGATAPTSAPSTPPRAPPQTPLLTPARPAAVRPPIIDAEIIEDVPASPPPKRRPRQLGAGASTPTTIPRQKRRRG